VFFRPVLSEQFWPFNLVPRRDRFHLRAKWRKRCECANSTPIIWLRSLFLIKADVSVAPCVIQERFVRTYLAALMLFPPLAAAQSALCTTVSDNVFANGFETAVQRLSTARMCYVAPNGLDSNPGTQALPFRSVQRCADVATAGDSCVLRAGTYRETVRPANSGNSSAPVRFISFAGEIATISGADPISNWQLETGSVYRANIILPIAQAASSGFLANQLFANGDMLPQARYPNAALPFDPLSAPMANSGASLNGNVMTLTNSDIPTIGGGWNGAIIWGTEWFVSRTATVTASASGQLTATNTDASNWTRAPFWWTLTGARGALDAPGEWHYDAATQSVFLWSPNAGAPLGIEAKQRNLAFDLAGRSHIQIENIRLFAASITTDNQSQSVVIDGLRAKYLSHYLTLPDLPPSEIQPGTDGFGLIGAHIHDSGLLLQGSGHTLKNSKLSVSAGNLLLLRGSQHLIENNIFEDANYQSSYAAAIQVAGSGHRIVRNTLRRAARSAINIDWKLTGLNASDIEIAYNDISAFGTRSTDLGAIYVCCYTNMQNSRIHHNVIRNGYGFSQFWGTRGIYLDIASGFNATIDHNLIYEIDFSADNFNASIGTDRGQVRVYNNTFVGPAELAQGVEARNNIIRSSATITATVQSNNVLGSDPVFVDAAARNYGLQATSPAVDAGVVIPGITDGFVGAAPDIGAFERGAVPWRAGAELPE
jgi:hypothetical protein